ncbi:6-phosphogluconolactonase [Microbacterium sp. SORGH_AS_0888]|uniref:6-phosphogluconolactonase n=1 Tax=Microbacterium sp. SORGH_AS_0888 TaxID=3041791 RepID=UPI00278ABC0F|nr:6-phosphogluconolactonase [Microbacterium sp. SORGH_AS_0888]MDQ1129979.1 6-phosphogluconolactonase [Microbacterium sp. SORGH_AS_0888]
MTYGEIRALATAADVAAEAARDAIDTLAAAIERHGSAVWVLAGGSSPMAAYRIISSEHSDAVDWSRVHVLIGDERAVPLDDPDSNWGTIAPVLLTAGLDAVIRLRPEVERPAEEAARRYADVLSALPATASGAPRLDLVWLGVGEDGHTLSLFPGHPDFRPTDELVAVVHDSPKPPPTRITLTLAAMAGAQRAVVFATGAAKREALAEALAEGQLPIAVVAGRVVDAGGEVVWLFDEAARG